MAGGSAARTSIDAHTYTYTYTYNFKQSYCKFEVKKKIEFFMKIA